MPPADLAARALAIIAVLDAEYPAAWTRLEHQNIFEFAVAAILSSQTTDESVNDATRFLFKKYPTPAALVQADLDELRTELEAVNFGSAKARYLIGFAEGLLSRHGGEVPRTMEELVALPGIGRKIANVILGTGYGIASGIVVDTHVIRLAQRLGLSAHKDPKKIEVDLIPLVPEAKWVVFAHRLQAHGRKICTARRPKCSVCPLFALCPKIGVGTHE